MSGRVLILGGRAPVALDHARRFHRLGWHVQVADSIPCRLTGWSSAVAATHALHPARFDARGFARDLNRIVRDQRIDLVLPTCEEALHLARHRATLPASLHVAVDAFDTLAALHSKWDFLRIARQHGMPVPDSARVHTLAQAREWAQGRAVVLKPEFSRFGVHVRLYPQGIPADAAVLPALGAWVVQDYLAGDELCSYAIAHQGRLLAHAIYRPTYRLRRSSSYYFHPVQRPAVRDAVAALVRGTHYSGQLSFDWIEAADGSARALECNPRATSGLHLFPSDVDLPAALLGEGGLREPVSPRARMIAVLMATAGLQDALTRGQPGAWRADWRRADDVIAVPGDRRPPLGSLLDLASYGRLALRQGCTLREAATRDIEWDGEPLQAVQE
ncbi:ATP-grasp domain-containing protein [Stenotrophomonas sp. BIGb0135]|uniref:ATP-grasp domain-containing protein n=1 Tax=Stenotrophomonas sp. BIGb0135 TaxID=2940620 RepID=UPI0021687A2A|nr:ATP-grasp domain-containing protein [Stenotrophomonas sp. BIGb0135]MCS4236590.1 putative ATP-grasp superfamily ATP-dependent carboligase [Stenotrophomonas sp. BIGb0135]